MSWIRTEFSAQPCFPIRQLRTPSALFRTYYGVYVLSVYVLSISAHVFSKGLSLTFSKIVQTVFQQTF